MQLYYTTTSPYVRKVRLVAHELGLGEQITLHALRPDFRRPDPLLSTHNPLSKIPVLVAEGLALYDSPVIVDYLIAKAEEGGGGTGTLARPEGREHWLVQQRQALADGLLDAALLIFYEREQRPLAQQWAPWYEGQALKVGQALDVLEQSFDTGFPLTPAEAAQVNVGDVAVAAALGWLTLRGVVEFREGRPRLAGWFEAFEGRASMRATRPEVGM